MSTQPQQQPVTLTDILNEVGQAKQKRTRVKALQKFDSYALKTLLQGNFSSEIQFPFPAGQPPFEKNEQVVSLTPDLLSALGDCVTANRKLPQLAKERRFISLLESIHFSDAHLLCLMKDGELESEYPWLTREVVSEAFSNLL